MLPSGQRLAYATLDQVESETEIAHGTDESATNRFVARHTSSEPIHQVLYNRAAHFKAVVHVGRSFVASSR
jgi:hypothetical protein